MYVREIGLEDVDRVHQAQKRDWRLAVVITVKSLRVP
jgi:hypothetical protein